MENLLPRGERIIRFVREWTLPVAIVVGSVSYLTFYWVPQLDGLGTALSPVFDVIFPLFVFLTLFVTFCKVDYHQLMPHRWHAGILVAQLLMVLVVATVCWLLGDASPTTHHPSSITQHQSPNTHKLLWEAVLTCIIGPSASAAPVVVGKLGGNINTMTTYTILSSLVAAVLIPVVFPILEPSAGIGFVAAFLVILEKVAIVLLLPLLLGWIVKHWMPRLQQRIASMPNLSFYFWAVSLSITTGITVKNIVHSQAGVGLLLSIAAATFLLCFVQFAVGRAIGRWLGEEINAGQGLFQKNTALSIWVAYMYLNPVASVGAGCYVLWQNIINSFEIYQYGKCKQQNNH